MIETIYNLAQGDRKTIEKVMLDENIHYMHMILGENDFLPEHYTNAKNVYMTVVRGMLSIQLDEQEFHEYPAGTMLKLPFHVKMNVVNKHSDTLELIVVKAPAPTK